MGTGVFAAVSGEARAGGMRLGGGLRRGEAAKTGAMVKKVLRTMCYIFRRWGKTALPAHGDVVGRGWAGEEAKALAMGGMGRG